MLLTSLYLLFISCINFTARVAAAAVTASAIKAPSVPMLPNDETRLSYRISCGSKKHATQAAKLLTAYRECLNDLVKL